jgi:hypothetical protein
MMPRTPSPWRKLKKQEIAQVRRRFEESIAQGDTSTYRAVYQSLQVATVICLPLGELLNPKLEGWLLAWKMAGRPFMIGRIKSGLQFAAQGIEGMVTIEGVSLAHALLASDETGLFRIEIFVPRAWQWEDPPAAHHQT